MDGDDDHRVMSRLLKQAGLHDVQVVSLRGQLHKDGFRDQLANVFNFSINAIAVVCDAEASRDAQFNRICHHLRQHCSVPATVNTWTILPDRKVGIFVLPGPTGMLEDLLVESATNSPPSACVNEFMRCLDHTLPKRPDGAEYQAWFFPAIPSKAKAKAYLVASHESVPHVGLGADKGIWDFNHPCFDELKAFLRGFSP
ncbi:MAG: DUF3226 domain-containing protein [Phycisphaeraceae bacterium]